MRKLAAGQSVVFCIPEEIGMKIREMTGGDGNNRPMSVADVLEWAIRGTWTDLRRSMLLWLTEGTAFAKRKTIWDRVRAGGGDELVNGPLADQFLEKESRSLEERYLPRDGTDFHEVKSDGDPAILAEIAGRRGLYDGTAMSSSALHEKQETELVPKMEQERQLERPGPADAAEHAIHPDVESYVKDLQNQPQSKQSRVHTCLRDLEVHHCS